MRGLRRLTLVTVLGAFGVLMLSVAPAFASATFDMAAHTSFDRTYTWSIHKVAHDPSITLTSTGTFVETYNVTVANTGYVDSNWKVQDGIHYYGTSFTPTSVGAVVSPGIAATISDPVDDASRCSTVLGTTVQDLYCSYAASLPDGSARSVTATIGLQGGGSVSNTLAFDFTNPTSMGEFNKCVIATDTLQGVLGTVCVGDSPVTFTYTRTIGPYGGCGDFHVDNTASLNDDAVHPSSSSATVDVHIPCVGGCTRTIGYWKTHAGFGPQADVVTPLLPVWLGTAAGAKSQNITTAALAVQFLSFDGSNNVFAASNGVNKLYAQLLAAKLNIASGGDGSAIAGTIAAADAFLAANNTTSWAGLSKSAQQSVLAWMTALDNYNNGLTGPGHCDDV
jgi:hypothetical protein